MDINVLVTGALYSSQSGYSALQFCRASIEAGHLITQVFFYQDGVTQATKLSKPLDDEFDLAEGWARFGKEHAVPLFLCLSAGERRGVMAQEQADEYQLDASNVLPGFNVAGLGVLHEASLDSDRTVTFK